jgi:hypothetical protein
MRSTLTILLLASFVVIAVFGIFGMHLGVQNHDDGCIAAVAQGTDCPKQSDPVDYFGFHLDAFKGFSTATFGENLLASLFAFVFFAAGMWLRMLFGHVPLVQCGPGHSRYRRFEFFDSPLKRDLVGWLALHENSPALRIGRRRITVFVSSLFWRGCLPLRIA